ncbi:hypothetical protein CYMTET_23435 [Cymbomonas tetramitiformis]|uniref:Tetratricopeptide repeat protein n=1 Tax=Cymbomonas tetramitiformis TaxID=36881 RepID=A0AAE0L0Y6_9CHLO|nr:hypothetical protein CYMTET_23435 [Cymbomonas tetramitiformis]
MRLGNGLSNAPATSAKRTVKAALPNRIDRSTSALLPVCHSQRTSEHVDAPTFGRKQVLYGLAGIASFVNLQEAFGTSDVARIRVEETPDQAAYDPNDATLREAALKLQEGLKAPTVEKEEAIWTEIIEKYEGLQGDWVPEIVGRTYGNRGNARSRQGKFETALVDYEKAIELCPWSVEPVLNRGVLYENTGQLALAERDYRAVLQANPEDPVGWNNLGNVQMGTGNFTEALVSLDRATRLSPEFAFAAANHSLAQFELGESNLAIKEMRAILRRYPEFPESRAALAAALWAEGLEVQAETEWQRVNDPRYKDKSWLAKERRWPPKIRDAFEAFLDVRSL